ncbi:MAG: UvrD-helicase domain-containing protein [Treponema sp.]|nr:UvrD-helicase domain-containing protein [Treponema sp.]
MSNIRNDSFLELLEKPLDTAQLQALRAENNAVIAAGAGSGKTQVLATRFAWLVLTGQAKADQILTLTFTNKAAAEMYQRIYQTLKFFSQASLGEKEKTLAQEALKDFANAHIQTLDSYSASIVRQCANRYGIKPDFSTGSADGKHNIRQQAFSYLLGNLNHPAVKAFAKAGGLQNYAEEILAMTIDSYTNLASPKGFFIEKFNLQISKLSEDWNLYFLGDSLLSRAISTVEAALNDNPAKDDLSKAPYVNALRDAINAFYSLKDMECISDQDIHSNSEKLQKAIQMVKAFINTFMKLPKFKSGYIQKIRPLITSMRDDQIKTANAMLSYISQYPEIRAQMELFDDFMEKVNESKRLSGQLSFTDVTAMALKILKEQEDIRNQEKNAYKKIMIDEFQDNNGRNRDLLYILALKPGEFEDKGKCVIEDSIENPLISQIIIRKDGKIIEDKRSPGKLFFVGDEKQSIYRFRGADVSVFNELTKDGENELIPMTYNYRSDKELVEAFNLIFKNGEGIFLPLSEKTDREIFYEAYYKKEALKNGIELPELNKENVPIHLAILDEEAYQEKEEWAKENELELLPKKEEAAYFIAKKIYELGKEEQNWDNFAILDKSRTDRRLITRYLSLFNIPYVLDQASNLFEEGLINDFYNFLRLCVYPNDKNALASYLTSPFCGLSLAKVEELLADNINLLDEDCMADQGFFRREAPLVLQRQLTETLSILWQEKGYKYETMLTAETNLCAEHFDLLFELARQADSQGKSIAWFIDQLEIIKHSLSKEDADLDASSADYPLERESAVRIMTIHKSKGLQFKHVFLYGCFNAGFKGNKNSIIFDEKYGVTIKTEKGEKNYFQLLEDEFSKKKEVAEFRRLIYVGITRAISDVWVVGSYKAEKKENTATNLRLFEKMIENDYPQAFSSEDESFYKEGLGYDLEKLPIMDYSCLSKEEEDLDSLRKEALVHLREAYAGAREILIENKAVPRSSPSALEKEADKEDIEGGEKYEKAEDYLENSHFSAADFGTLVHSYMEAFINGLNPKEYQPAKALFKDLSDKEIEENKAVCIKYVEEFAQSPKGKEAMEAKAAGRFIRAEWAFRMFLKGTIYTGSIDLIYENPDKSYTIVDYKSDKEIKAEYYRAQQECYREAASKMLKVKQDKISLYLYFIRHKETVQL